MFIQITSAVREVVSIFDYLDGKHYVSNCVINDLLYIRPQMKNHTVNTGSTWSNVGGLNIDIDNLSLGGKPRSNAPSMNQMAHTVPVVGVAGAGSAYMSPMPMSMMNTRPMAPNSGVGMATGLALPLHPSATGFAMSGANVMGVGAVNNANGMSSPTLHSAFGK